MEARACFFLAFSLLISASLNATAGGKQLILQAPVEDRGDKLKFGQAACASNDGRRVAIGANGFEKYKGTLYVYDLASGSGERMEQWRRTRLSGSDTEHAEEKKPRELRVVGRGSGFGFSCAMDDAAEQIVVGAPGHDLQKGAAYIFSYSRATRAWKETGKLEAPERRNSDSFGWAVAVNDACDTVIVSAKGRRANNGEVYVFQCSTGCTDCALSSRLSPPDYTDSAGPRGIRIRNNFGVSMVLSGNGKTLAVGSTGYNQEQGAVYIFSKFDSVQNWTLVQRVESQNAQQFGFFGFKIAIDREGRKLAVGADGEDNYRGAVYTFERNVTGTKDGPFGAQQEIMPLLRAAEDNFGGSIAMSADGRVLIVGAPGANKGSAKDHGVAYVYEEIRERSGGVSDGGKWELSESVRLPSGNAQSGNFFAWTVAVSGDASRLVMTAPESYSGSGLAAFSGFEVSGRRPPDARSLVHDDVVSLYKEDL